MIALVSGREAAIDWRLPSAAEAPHSRYGVTQHPTSFGLSCECLKRGQRRPCCPIPHPWLGQERWLSEDVFRLPAKRHNNRIKTRN